MKDVKEVLADKKFVLILNLIRVLHREHLEIVRIVLMFLLKPDRYKETFHKIESDWDEIITTTIHEGLNVKEEDFYD